MFLLMELDEFLGPVNLGNPQETSMLELARRIIEMTDSKSGIDYGPLPPDDPGRRRPDISLARTKTGWEPEVSLRGGPAPYPPSISARSSPQCFGNRRSLLDSTAQTVLDDGALSGT